MDVTDKGTLLRSLEKRSRSEKPFSELSESSGIFSEQLSEIIKKVILRNTNFHSRNGISRGGPTWNIIIRPSILGAFFRNWGGPYAPELHRNMAADFTASMRLVEHLFWEQAAASSGSPSSGKKVGFPSSCEKSRDQKINANFFWTKFCKHPSGHGRPRPKSWTSFCTKKCVCLWPHDGEKRFDPWPPGRSGSGLSAGNSRPKR